MLAPLRLGVTDCCRQARREALWSSTVALGLQVLRHQFPGLKGRAPCHGVAQDCWRWGRRFAVSMSYRKFSLSIALLRCRQDSVVKR